MVVPHHQHLYKGRETPLWLCLTISIFHSKGRETAMVVPHHQHLYTGRETSLWLCLTISLEIKAIIFSSK